MNDTNEARTHYYNCLKLAKEHVSEIMRAPGNCKMSELDNLHNFLSEEVVPNLKDLVQFNPNEFRARLAAIQIYTSKIKGFDSSSKLNAFKVLWELQIEVQPMLVKELTEDDFASYVLRQNQIVEKRVTSFLDEGRNEMELSDEARSRYQDTYNSHRESGTLSVLWKIGRASVENISAKVIIALLGGQD